MNTFSRTILFLCVFLSSWRTAEAAPRHALFTGLLAAHVRDGLVDYRALKADNRLERYLELLAAADPAALPSRKDLLAFWINVYNAQTLKLIADNYPVKSIGELHYGRSLVLATALRKTAWHTHRFVVGGKEYTLDAVEHAILRPVFKDFRIHAAIVCAALSCPPLRGEAYEGDAIDRQLDEQMRSFLANRALNRFDGAGNTLYLSKIFSWFEKDFTGGKMTIVEALLPYFPADIAGTLKAKGRDVKIVYLPYDWGLNGR